MIDNKIPISRHSTKPQEYTLDKRVFVVTPVYRDNGENTKDILIKFMREEARVKNAKHCF